MGREWKKTEETETRSRDTAGLGSQVNTLALGSEVTCLAVQSYRAGSTDVQVGGKRTENSKQSHGDPSSSHFPSSLRLRHHNVILYEFASPLSECRPSIVLPVPSVQ